MAHKPKNPSLSIASAAEQHNVSPSTIRRLIASGHLRAYRLGERTIRIDPDDLTALYEEVNPNTYAHIKGQ